MLLSRPPTSCLISEPRSIFFCYPDLVAQPSPQPLAFQPAAGQDSKKKKTFEAAKVFFFAILTRGWPCSLACPCLVQWHCHSLSLQPSRRLRVRTAGPLLGLPDGVFPSCAPPGQDSNGKNTFVGQKVFFCFAILTWGLGCLLACLPAWLLACLPCCVVGWLCAWLLACLLACLPACLPTPACPIWVRIAKKNTIISAGLI